MVLIEGGQEQALPGGDAEGKFCVSLSKLVNLDEVKKLSETRCRSVPEYFVVAVVA